MPKVVNCKKESYDVYIGRPSKWGNPFTYGKRKDIINKYRQWFLTQENLINDLPELKNKVLGCWCKPKNCHGDVLVEMFEKFVGNDKFSLLE
ncbi:MAG: DUF4326 domain-containing protein [Atribacterota bacterium]